MDEHNFAKLKNSIELPQLTELEKLSYNNFLHKSIGDLLKEVSPITNFNGSLRLYLEDYFFTEPNVPYTTAVEKNLTYSVNLMVKCRLENDITKDVTEQVVYFGDIPMMTENDTFIINGTTKVIVSQIVRSPGIYYTKDENEYTFNHLEGLIMPNTGAWMEMENDGNGIMYIKPNKKKKILATVFLRAMKESEEEIKEILTPEIYDNCIAKDSLIDYESSIKEVFKKIRPGEPASMETAKGVLKYYFASKERYNLCEFGRYKINNKTGLDISLDTHVLTKEDIIEFIKGFVKIYNGGNILMSELDDIDHLGNRRIRSVGELVEERFKRGLAIVTRNTKEAMSMKDIDHMVPNDIINPKALKTTVKEFFLVDQLSQMMEAANPLSEIANKRRISAIGKGGLKKDRAGFKVRDVHYSHYGRLCHIETPEGSNIGLIMSLASYASIDKYGFITTPYRKIDKKNRRITDEIEYLNACEEEKYYVASSDLKIDDSGHIVDDYVITRHRDKICRIPADEVDYMGISSIQTISIPAATIPFLEHDDSTRAAMGSNMQRQALPLIENESPLVSTGMEKIMGDEYSKHSPCDGVIEYCDCTKIVLLKDDGQKETFNLINFWGTKKETCIREHAVVKKGQKVKKGDILYYKYCISEEDGCLSIGKSVLVGYTTWEGYNYEDSVLISDRLVKDDVYTSIHIERHKVELRETKQGKERFTKEIPQVGKTAVQNLDDDGFIKIGTVVKAGDILIGKVVPKVEKERSPEDSLIDTIMGRQTVKDSSYKMPHGDWGVVIKIDHLIKKNGDELDSGVLECVYVYVAKFRKIGSGDKMSGRHGNKGVISKVLPAWEMPHLEDGTPLDIALNPMGVPSRMNIGQVEETHLGWAAKKLNKKYIVPPFDGPSDDEIKAELRKAGLPESGKTTLYDPRTGKAFNSPITVGYPYMLKLYHLVDEKVHARSTGSYALVTQQPLGGKAQRGGQKFGEMEVWALEAYGAAHTLQEMLTIKSDDRKGRDDSMRAILDNKPIPSPNIPESFKVLEKELNGLCMELIINNQENVTKTSEEELTEERFNLDKLEINEKAKPWKEKDNN